MSKWSVLSLLRFGDILQGDFLEDYYLLAHKSINFFTWIKEKCQQVRTSINYSKCISIL